MNLHIFFIIIFFIPEVIFPTDIKLLTYLNFCGFRFNLKSSGFMNVSVQFSRIYIWILGIDISAENHKQKYLSVS